MPDHPLAEVLGFPIDNNTPTALRYKQHRLCPFNNGVPNCTKTSAENPLGVCSIHDRDDVTIICPIHFREDWLVATDAASFFFSGERHWTSLTEVRLTDEAGAAAGNIDLVLVEYDEHNHITDFGAVEVQAVYISGNIRVPYESYIADPVGQANLNWRGKPKYPRPDYLSSTRKRLAPQLLYKGGILNGWGKKLATAVHSRLFATLPVLPECDPAEADVAWLIYDLVLDSVENRYHLTHARTVYTRFQQTLDRITVAQAGPVDPFVAKLQRRLEVKLENAQVAKRRINVIKRRE